MSTYNTSAKYYDLIYRDKDYAGEVATLRRMIEEHGGPTEGTLLDVACGAGGHLIHLREYYTCAGVDLVEPLLDVARARLPGIPLYQGDMRTFDLGQQFDVVTCLFSAIGYMTTVADLNAAIANMARHVARGGVLAVEPWFPPGFLREGLGSARHFDEPDIQLTRMHTIEIVGNVSVMDMHHLVGTPEGVEHFVERHEMGLFTAEQYSEAITAGGLTSAYDAEGLTGRGLALGRRET